MLNRVPRDALRAPVEVRRIINDVETRTLYMGNDVVATRAAGVWTVQVAGKAVTSREQSAIIGAVRGRKIGDTAMMCITVPCATVTTAAAVALGGMAGAAHGLITEGPLGIPDGISDGMQRSLNITERLLGVVFRPAFAVGTATAAAGAAIGDALGRG